MHDELTDYLDALQQGQRYRVDVVLKESSMETTERVHLILADGSERGPYIRKLIDLDSGLGNAYERIWEAQQTGKRFMHLPHMLDCSVEAGQREVVMELVSGRTLEEAVAAADYDDKAAATIAVLLCDAVMELHDNFDPPLIHRDLKPSNVVVSTSNLTLIDFGIARSFDEKAERDTRSFGTRGYAPPEQFGYGQTDKRSDIYALGMLMAYCFLREDPSRELVEHGFDDARIPMGLRPVLAKATAFDPQARFGSVRELKDSPGMVLLLAEVFGVPSVEGEGQPGVTRPSGSSRAGAPERSMSQAGKHVHVLSSLIPRGLGTAWNVLVLGCWALFAWAAISLTLFPSPTEQITNPLVRGICYIGVFTIGFGCVAYALLDKRGLRKRFPRLARFPWYVESGVGVLAGFVIALISAALSSALNG